MLQNHFGAVNSEDVQRGRHIVESSCTNCHGYAGGLPRAYQFVTSEVAFKAYLRESPQRLWTALTYLESGRMPKGSRLSSQEIHDVQSYLLWLNE